MNLEGNPTIPNEAALTKQHLSTKTTKKEANLLGVTQPSIQNFTTSSSQNHILSSAQIFPVETEKSPSKEAVFSQRSAQKSSEIPDLTEKDEEFDVLSDLGEERPLEKKANLKGWDRVALSQSTPFLDGKTTAHPAMISTYVMQTNTNNLSKRKTKLEVMTQNLDSFHQPKFMKEVSLKNSSHKKCETTEPVTSPKESPKKLLTTLSQQILSVESRLKNSSVGESLKELKMPQKGILGPLSSKSDKSKRGLIECDQPTASCQTHNTKDAKVSKEPIVYEKMIPSNSVANLKNSSNCRQSSCLSPVHLGETSNKEIADSLKGGQSSNSSNICKPKIVVFC